MTALPPDAIADLARRLTSSAEDHDWPAVARYNKLVENLLTSLRPMPNDFRSVVAELQAAHQQAHKIVVEENNKLAERMARLRDNQDGLRAYEQSEGLV